jgi:hypothetical protein
MTIGRTLLLTNVGIASLSGSSQVLAAKDMTRSFLLIVNSGANTVYVNLTGGTAVASDPGSAPILTNGSLLLDVYAPGNAISIIGTAGQPVAAWVG